MHLVIICLILPTLTTALLSIHKPIKLHLTKCHAILPNHLPLLLAAELAPYEKEGIPEWIAGLSVSLVVVTVLVPVITRKIQLKRNSRQPSAEELEVFESNKRE
jgi:hypothetical protein